MRNLVAKNDHNRAATHLDRSKEPQLTVDEGLLDYFAESAENVAQRVYDNTRVTKAVRLLEVGDKAKDLSLSEFLDSLANR